jgi:hypothetical protein
MKHIKRRKRVRKKRFLNYRRRRALAMCEEVVRFLSRENASIRISELQTAEPRRVFEPHKLAAYEAWGIIERDEHLIRLSELGGELAKRNTFEKQIYRQILSNLPQYRSAVEWMGEQHLRIITFHDLADFWTDNFPRLRLGGRELREIENAALSFFSICHAAELGIMTVGKRGQPTRLSVNADEARKFLRRDCAPKIEIFPSAIENGFAAETKAENQTPRVYISLGESKEIDGLVELLELTGLESSTARDVSLENNFLSQTQISLMQNAVSVYLYSIKLIATKKTASSNCAAKKIIEINTALALFNGQITLLWDEEGNPPQNILETRLSFLRKAIRRGRQICKLPRLERI